MYKSTKDDYLFKRHSKMDNGHTTLSRLILALSLIYSGIVLIGYKTNYITPEVFHMIFNWQLLIIAIGAGSLAKKGNHSGGYVMILIGVFFLLPEFINIPFETRQLFWPAILIGAGIIVLIKGSRNISGESKFSFQKSDISDIDMINDNHIFSGGEFHITSENFKGGRISTIMGGGKYNLRNAKLAPGIQIIEVSLIFGGIELNVPAEWDVKVEVSSIFGGFSNKNFSYTKANETTGQLIIRGTAIFGGGEIKRF